MPIKLFHLARRPQTRVAVALLTILVLAVPAWQATNVRERIIDSFVGDIFRIGVYVLLLTGSCASFGSFLLHRLSFVAPPLVRLAVALPVGLVVFIMGLYAAGALSLFRPWFAVAWPLALLAVAARHVRGSARAAYDRLLTVARPPGILGYAAICFGCAALAVLWLQACSPSNLYYDAMWDHVVIAEDYARTGSFLDFDAHWVKNLPHLASLLYTWVYLLPGLPEAPQKWLAVLQCEFTVLLWTLLGVGAGVGFVSRRHAVFGAFAIMLAFPGLFVHDGSLGGGADHVAALFAVPLFLVIALGARSLDPRCFAIAGLLAGGALSTKVQAVAFVAPSVLLSLLIWVRALIRRKRSIVGGCLESFLLPSARLWQVPALFAGACLLVLAPYLLRNVVFHGNPIYPIAQGVLGGHPTVPDAPVLFAKVFADWRWQPPVAAWDKLLAALRLVVMFPYEPHYSFVGKPSFGFLFAIFALVPFVMRTNVRLRALSSLAILAVFFWALTYWVDRNLQVILPLLAVATGGAIVQLMRAGVAARVIVLAVVGLHTLWALPLMASGRGRIDGGLAMFTGVGSPEVRYARFANDYRGLGSALPRNSIVLLHNQHLSLGIDRPVMLDWLGYQGLIDHRTWRTPRDMHHRLRALGVTHVVYTPDSRPAATRQEDVIVSAYSEIYGGTKSAFGIMRLFEVPHAPPPQESDWKVIVRGIAGYADGLYTIEQLGVLEELPPGYFSYPTPRTHIVDPEDVAQFLPNAQAIVLGSQQGLPADFSARLNDWGRRVKTTPQFTVWVAHARR